MYISLVHCPATRRDPTYRRLGEAGKPSLDILACDEPRCESGSERKPDSDDRVSRGIDESFDDVCHWNGEVNRRERLFP